MNTLKPLFFKTSQFLPKNTRVIDAFNNGMKELFFIENPKYKYAAGKAEVNNLIKKFLRGTKIRPVWIYFPWRKTAVKNLPEHAYFELRTNRNKNIINFKEQMAYRKIRVGIAGLSVGSSIVAALNLSGGPKSLKIADFDSLEATNLNRIHATLLDIGENKTEIACRRLWELDPYLNIEPYPNGLAEKNLPVFLLKPKIDVFVDAMDNIALKIQARQYCKKFKIPVLMATDNGDGVILDVERFDLNRKTPIFFGKISEQELKLAKANNYGDWLKLAVKILGYSDLDKKIKSSMKKIGKTIVAIPQLGTTANLAGSVISLALRKIANKEKMNSGRYLFNLEGSFHAKRS